MEEYKSLEEYKASNKEFLSQSVVKSFFSYNSDNWALLESAFVDRNKESKRELDKSFAEHFFLYRLIKYIITTSRFYSIDFDKLSRRHQAKYSLIIDQPVKDDNDESMIDYLSFRNFENQQDSINTDTSLLDLVENEVLYKALQKLNTKEQKVLHLIFIEQMKQVEVSKLFGDSPQNIGKIKRTALAKLKKTISKGER